MTVLPLILLWAMSRGGSLFGSTPAPKAKAKPPKWPTPASPPPMPAFTPQMPAASPTADANTATPLAKLAQPPKKAPKPKPKPKPSPAAQAAQAARSAPAAQVLQAVRTGRVPGAKLPGGLRLPGFASSFGFGSSTPMKVATVYDLQGLLNTWGAALKRDGLYGPRTANTWQAMAKKHNLPPQISRNGPKTARVAVQTFDAFSVPHIP